MPWGDDAAPIDYPDDDGGDLPDLPDRYESEIDVNGVKTITTFRTNEAGHKIKTVRTVRVAKKTTKVPKAVVERRSWPKFGVEKGKAAGFHGRGFLSAHTQLDMHEYELDLTPKLKAVQERNESAQRAFEKQNMTSFEAWRPKQRDVSSAKEWAEANGLAPSDGAGGEGGGYGSGNSTLAALAAKSGGGGAPAAEHAQQAARATPRWRRATPSHGARNSGAIALGAIILKPSPSPHQVRVSNLSEDVKDSDLRELFRRFGAIQRIYLAKDRDTRASRGFAFINFFDRGDAQRAIDKLDGHGYDHLILSVGWANPAAAARGRRPA